MVSFPCLLVIRQFSIYLKNLSGSYLKLKDNSTALHRNVGSDYSVA